MSSSSRDQASPHRQGASPSPPTYAPETSTSPVEDDDLHQDPSQPDDPLPPFEPVFTMLTNTTTNTTTHPRVHYIFSDDDPSLLPSSLAAASADHPSRRAILVDLLPSQPSASASPTPAWRVSWAASLSPDFALTSSRLAEQQHDSTSGGGSGGNATDVMLRLEGVEREAVELEMPKNRRRTRQGAEDDSEEEEAGASGTAEMEDKEALVEDFRRRMGVLRRVVDESAKREAVVAAERGGEEGQEDEDDDDDDDDDDEEAVASAQRSEEEVMKKA